MGARKAGARRDMGRKAGEKVRDLESCAGTVTRQDTSLILAGRQRKSKEWKERR